MEFRSDEARLGTRKEKPGIAKGAAAKKCMWGGPRKSGRHWGGVQGGD